ncbi:MAG: DoxX family protein [Pseudomonadota bacterium]
MAVIRFFINLYDAVFSTLQKITEDWFLGITARLFFCSVLFWYFINSAFTKVGATFPDTLIPTDSAYIQILGEKLFEQYSFSAAQIPVFPYKIIVFLGTYTEFILPVLILIGLFTRFTAVAFIFFIFVLTYVDITQHGVDVKTIGEIFDRVHNSEISDQRLLWTFPLLYLILRGPGVLSLDFVLGKIFGYRKS